MAKNCKKIIIKKNQNLFQQGDAVSDLFILKEG